MAKSGSKGSGGKKGGMMMPGMPMKEKGKGSGKSGGKGGGCGK